MHLSKSYTLMAMALAARAAAHPPEEMEADRQSTTITAPAAAMPSHESDEHPYVPIETPVYSGGIRPVHTGTSDDHDHKSSATSTATTSKDSTASAYAPTVHTSSAVIPSNAPAASSTALIKSTPAASKAVPSSSAHKPTSTSSSQDGTAEDGSAGNGSPSGPEVTNPTSSSHKLIVPGLLSLAGVGLGFVYMV